MQPKKLKKSFRAISLKNPEPLNPIPRLNPHSLSSDSKGGNTKQRLLNTKTIQCLTTRRHLSNLLIYDFDTEALLQMPWKSKIEGKVADGGLKLIHNGFMTSSCAKKINTLPVDNTTQWIDFSIANSSLCIILWRFQVHITKCNKCVEQLLYHYHWKFVKEFHNCEFWVISATFI